MYDQPCDLSPFDQRILPKLDPSCIYQQGFRETYHPYNSPSCFYSKNSPLGGCSSNFSTQVPSYASNFTFGTAALNALNNMNAQGFTPSAFGKMKPSGFSPSEHQMIRSEKNSLEDTQNLLDDQNTCEEEDQEAGRSQYKAHSSSTILNYPPCGDYSNKQMQFMKYGSSNTQTIYNPSQVSAQMTETMQYQQANIPQNCHLDQSGEFQNRQQFLEKNALGQHGVYSCISQPDEAQELDQCNHNLAGENLFPLKIQYPSNFQSVGDFNHNTQQNHYSYQHHNHHHASHPHQNYQSFQQQISNHQMIYPEQSQITQGNNSQSQQFYGFNQPQLSNSLHSTTFVDSPSNCTQQFHQFPRNEDYHNEFQTIHHQKQHLQQQYQLHQQQQQFQYSRQDIQSNLANNNGTLLQNPQQLQRIQKLDPKYQQQNSIKSADQAQLELHSQQNHIHSLFQGNLLASMPITKIESIEQNSPNKSIEDQKNDDSQEENSSNEDSEQPSQSSISSSVSSENSGIHQKQIKQSQENHPVRRKIPERLKGPNSKRLNRSNSVSSKNNTCDNLKISKKQTNETKNIPKNYSKAIIGYIQKHPEDCAKLLGTDLTFSEFESFLMEKKEKLTAIKDLRSLWTAKAADKKQETFNRVFRILSFKFFREDAVAYIYSSHKIKNTRALITYRFILQRALHDPESFQFMKFQN